MLSRNSSRILCLLILESILICLFGVAALYIVDLYFPFESGVEQALIAEDGWAKMLLMMVIMQGSFYLFDLYEFREIRKQGLPVVRILHAIGVAAIILAFILFAFRDLLFNRYVVLTSMLLMFIPMTAWRLFVMWLFGHPRLAERVLILGTEGNAVEIAREALERPGMGYKIVGFVGDEPALVGKSLINPTVLGLADDIEEIVSRHNISRIVVAINDRRGHMPLGPLVDLKLRDGVAIEEMGSFYERLTGKVHTKTLRPSWLIFSGTSGRLRLYRHARRLFDIVFSAVGLLLALPVMAITAIAIKLDSRGPVIYKQERVGERNRTFTIMKFRSMRLDAESTGPVWAERDDPRITRVGRVIRKLRIDELPQFVNIIRGEMAVIGPRPERTEFVKQLERQIPYYSQRHLVKPGLTGWAQIRYPYGASVEDAIEKLQYDLYYIKNQSPLLDAVTLFETVRIVLFGRGAR
jgi:sugar transferase (PEP-CTERM system associated)